MKRIDVVFAAAAAVFVVSGCDGGGAPAPVPAEATLPAAPLVIGPPDTVALLAAQDTSVRQSAPNQNFGAAADLDINRTLVAFDQAALRAAVGAQDFVVAARLEFTLTSNQLRRLAPVRAVSAHRMKKAWTELGATWNCAVDANTGNRREDCAGATAWSMGVLPPNPFVVPATASTTIAPRQTGVIAFDVTTDVRGFVAGALPNHGWMLRGGVAAEFAEFAARETATPPRLVLSVRRCSPTLCNDGNACTVDSCNAEATCVYANAADGASCSDGDMCTGGDQCRAGACTRGTVDLCAPPPVVFNEIESNGGTPGDWVELYNRGSSAVDLGGFIFRDNDDTHSYALPAGTTIPAGGYLVLDEAAFGFGLGGADSARLFTPTNLPVDSHAWTAHAPVTYGRCPNGSGSFSSNLTSTKGAANDCSTPPDAGPPDAAPDAGSTAAIVLNEIESNGGTPGDWAELYNPTAAAVDLSGWVVRDNDDTHNHVIAAGTVIAPGGYFLVEEAALGFGLGAADSVRVFAPSGILVDSHAWTTHAAVTYGRCPNATGAFSSNATATKGASNDCGSPPDAGVDTGPPATPWPGESAVTTVDQPMAFAGNLSGLTYQPAAGAAPAILWAVQNNPSKLYRLEASGTQWVNSTVAGWETGKTMVYPNGSGVPDSEGVTRAEDGSAALYVATERDNMAGTSRMSVLRFDSAAAGATLTATHEWNLTADLPMMGPNLGLEAITWLPDSALLASGFHDERTGATYAPATYPNHGGGLFLVGVEGNGILYAYALDHSAGTAQRIATLPSGFPGVMGLEYDRDTNRLWAYCDNTCANRAKLFAIETAPGPLLGRFNLRATYDRPATIPVDMNNEGIAFAPAGECTSGLRSFFFADDSATAGHSLRRGTITCGLLP